MSLGLALAMLRARPLEETIHFFVQLQKKYPLVACEVHLGGIAVPSRLLALGR